MFLVLITLLQHTHASLPRYVESEWEWLKGALCTIDRDYGVLNHGESSARAPLQGLRFLNHGERVR